MHAKLLSRIELSFFFSSPPNNKQTALGLLCLPPTRPTAHHAHFSSLSLSLFFVIATTQAVNNPDYSLYTKDFQKQVEQRIHTEMQE